MESIIKLQKEAELDIVCIDLWSFDYKNNKLYIHSGLVSRIEILANSLPQMDLMIGELGFRLNDREAYIDPWNWARPIVYEKGARLRFFEDIFEHLGVVGINVSYLGIWSWNDGVYSISDDLDTQRVIIDHAKNLGLIPKDLCIDKHYGDSEFNMEKTRLHIPYNITNISCHGVVIHCSIHWNQNNTKTELVGMYF